MFRMCSFDFQLSVNHIQMMAAPFLQITYWYISLSLETWVWNKDLSVLKDAWLIIWVRTDWPITSTSGWRVVASVSVGTELLSASVNRHVVVLSDRLLKFSLWSRFCLGSLCGDVLYVRQLVSGWSHSRRANVLSLHYHVVLMCRDIKRL